MRAGKESASAGCGSPERFVPRILKKSCNLPGKAASAGLPTDKAAPSRRNSGGAETRTHAPHVMRKKEKAAFSSAALGQAVAVRPKKRSSSPETPDAPLLTGGRGNGSLPFRPFSRSHACQKTKGAPPEARAPSTCTGLQRDGRSGRGTAATPCPYWSGPPARVRKAAISLPASHVPQTARSAPAVRRFPSTKGDSRPPVPDARLPDDPVSFPA